MPESGICFHKEKHGCIAKLKIGMKHFQPQIHDIDKPNHEDGKADLLKLVSRCFSLISESDKDKTFIGPALHLRLIRNTLEARKFEDENFPYNCDALF